MMHRVPAFASLLLFIKQRRAVARRWTNVLNEVVLLLLEWRLLDWLPRSVVSGAVKAAAAVKHSGTDVLFILAQHQVIYVV